MKPKHFELNSYDCVKITPPVDSWLAGVSLYMIKRAILEDFFKRLAGRS